MIGSLIRPKPPQGGKEWSDDRMVAHVLGWENWTGKRDKQGEKLKRMNHMAVACAAAYKLIKFEKKPRIHAGPLQGIIWKSTMYMK